MKAGLLLLAVGAVALVLSLGSSVVRPDLLAKAASTSVPSHVAEMFDRWVHHHNKKYASPSERAYRLKTFYKTYLDVVHHNSDPAKTYEKGLTVFADMEEDEFAARMRTASSDSNAGLTGPKRSPRTNSAVLQNLQAMPVPESVDWSFSKMVGQVRDIGSCGGCYAIAAVEAIEVAYFQAKGSYVQCSAQEILECSNTPPFTNNGCNGGSIIDSFLYINKRGLASEAAYPYTGRLQRCQSSVPRFIPQDKIDYIEVPVGESDALKTLVAQRPVSTKMNFDGLKSYTGGIYYGDKCANIATHYVTIVGYDTILVNQKKVHYWIIKNNVGSSFGENGYLRVVRAQGSNPSVCGITEYAIYPYFLGKI